MKTRYEYSCKECGGEVKKYKSTGEAIPSKTPGQSLKAGLHGWMCQTHGKGVSVKRKMKGSE